MSSRCLMNTQVHHSWRQTSTTSWAGRDQYKWIQSVRPLLRLPPPEQSRLNARTAAKMALWTLIVPSEEEIPSKGRSVGNAAREVKTVSMVFLTLLVSQVKLATRSTYPRAGTVAHLYSQTQVSFAILTSKLDF